VTAGRVHLVSAGGDGGVFQHTVAVAHALGRAGARVTVHMPDWNEELDLGGLDVCRCVSWNTRFRRPLLRQASIALRYLTQSNLHLLRAVDRNDVLHFQGLFRPVLSASTIALQRVAGRGVVHSPHNTFAREGSRVDAFLIRLMSRAAHASIVFSSHDAEAVSRFGGRPVMSPLVLAVPAVDPERKRRWRLRWSSSADARVILFAGQIRRDKRLDLVIQSAAHWPDHWRLAVVGPDLGAWDPSSRLAEELGVRVAAAVGFCDLGDFAAAIAAADVVVCPYDHASQSGILAVARQLGTATVATDVGGLADYADRLLADSSPEEMTEAIAGVLEMSARANGARDDEAALVAAHQSAYALARRRR
jgi:glycosyltransferase involved in cell wall biosynthesis